VNNCCVHVLSCSLKCVKSWKSCEKNETRYAYVTAFGQITVLTARDFAEVNELRMWLQCATGREIGMLVAFVLPRIVVARQTGRSYWARFHAVFQRQELSEQLLSAKNVESFVDANDFHCNTLSQSSLTFLVNNDYAYASLGPYSLNPHTAMGGGGV